MNNRKMALGLVGFYAAVIFIAGCFPENLLEWSDDGSVGVIKVDKVLGLVDGKTGKFTLIAKQEENLSLGYITISLDGELIAYSMGFECSSLSDGLKQLPQNQVKLIAHYAQKLRDEVIRQGGLVNKKFPDIDMGPFRIEPYSNWVIRYMCENAGQKLIDKLTPEELEEGKSEEIALFKLFVATTDQAMIGERQLVTTNVFAMFYPKISPDNKFVAYLFHNEPYEDIALRFDLYAASLKDDVKILQLADYVAAGYSWRGDSKAIAYIENDIKEIAQEHSVGTLRTIEVADANGNLLAKPILIESAKQGSMATHLHTGKVTELAGVFFHPFMKVQYTSGRIFFSSATMNLPMSTIDDELRWSVFCYDPLTCSVTNVLPRQVSSYLVEDNAMGYFAISPDENRILLPMRKHRFMIYKFGGSSALSPIKESEEFGDSQGDNWSMMPAWKGNDEISCLVSEDFLIRQGVEKHSRKEVVVLGADGEFRRVLSESWPSEEMP